MQYMPWHILNLLHEERVNDALRASERTWRFRLFERKRNPSPSTLEECQQTKMAEESVKATT